MIRITVLGVELELTADEVHRLKAGEEVLIEQHDDQFCLQICDEHNNLGVMAYRHDGQNLVPPWDADIAALNLETV